MIIILDYFLPLLIGWLCGLVVNYLADTLPVKRKLTRPACPKCQNDMGFVNYFLWPRSYQSCGKRRQMRTWLVELFLVLSSIWLWRYAPAQLGYWIGLLWLVYFSLVTVIDIERRLILHIVSLIGLILGLLTGVRLHGMTSTLLGGAVGFLVMLALYFFGFLYLKLSKKLRGQQPEESEALGFGDVNLSGVIGLLLGWPGIIGGLVIAIVLGGFVSLIYLLYTLARRQYNPNISLPYGPFLAASAVILLYLRAYLY